MSKLPWETKKEEKEVLTTPTEPVIQAEKPVEKPKPVQPEEKLQNFVIHSEIDASILDRLKSQPKTLEEVDAQVFTKQTDTRHQLSIPEFEPYMAKYAFCWIFKHKKAIDEANDMYHWVFVRRNQFPELPDYLFTARGIVERGDEVLMFRSKAVDTEMRKAPGLESTERIKAREEAHKNDPKYYIPKPEDSEETRVIGV